MYLRFTCNLNKIKVRGHVFRYDQMLCKSGIYWWRLTTHGARYMMLGTFKVFLGKHELYHYINICCINLCYSIVVQIVQLHHKVIKGHIKKQTNVVALPSHHHAQAYINTIFVLLLLNEFYQILEKHKCLMIPNDDSTKSILRVCKP